MNNIDKNAMNFRNPDLPLDVRINDLLSNLTLDEKISLLPTRQAAVERLGIKAYSIGGEAAHGLVSRTGPATVYPQTIGLACTWDRELLHSIGSAVGDEARAYYKKDGEKGGLTLWAPTVDMERDPRWGRTEEAYGEDPFLTGELSSEYIRGMQGDHPFYMKMSAALKHFFANNNEKDRLTCSSSIDPRNLREYYLNAFKPAVIKGGVRSMMTAYNCVNGTPCIVNPIVRDTVKCEWGMDGFVVCDGADFNQTVNLHKYFDNHAESVAATLKSGIDCITDEAGMVVNAVRQALSLELLSEADIDRALKNIFKVRFRLGHFDPDSRNPYADIPESVICSAEHNKLSRLAAGKAIVLLKNQDALLPLDPAKTGRLSVIGPLANVIYKDWYTGIHPYKITPLEGIKSRLPAEAVKFCDGLDRIRLISAANGKFLSVNSNNGCRLEAASSEAYSELFELTDWGWNEYTLKATSNERFLTSGEQLTASVEEVWGWHTLERFHMVWQNDGTVMLMTWDDKYVCIDGNDQASLVVKAFIGEPDKAKFIIKTVESGLESAVAAAKASDTALVFVGNHPLINGREEFDREDIILPPHQEQLIRKVLEVNPRTIVVLVSSYPVAIYWADKNVPAILFTSHAGHELGNAIADVLFGDTNPAGRLNMTWYSSVCQLPDIMDYDIIKGKRTYQYFEGTPLYPFGHGLSYTEFEYSGLSLDQDVISAEGSITASLKVRNSGSKYSEEVVQLYLHKETSRVKRPIKQLKGFERISLEPGESKIVTFILPAPELYIWDVTRDKYCVESGAYKLMIGSSSADIRLSSCFTICGEAIPPRNLLQNTLAINYDDYDSVFLDECSEGGSCIACRQPDGWVSFRDVDFGTGVAGFETRTTSAWSEGSLEIRLDSLDGTLAGICRTPATGGWKHWTDSACSITGAEGKHDVYIKFKGKTNMSKFRFIQ